MYQIGVDIGGTNIKLGLVDEELNLAARTSVPFPHAGADAAADVIRAAADDVLRQGVQSISELIQTAGDINLDFADVLTVMKDAGYAHMGVGRAEGKDRAEEAAKAAVDSPLLETTIENAHGVLINIMAPEDLDFEEMEKATSTISDLVSPDATIIWGYSLNEKMGDAISVTVIATGLTADEKERQENGQRIIHARRDGDNSSGETPSLSWEDDDLEEINRIFSRRNAENNEV